MVYPRIDPEYIFVRRGRHLPLDKIQNILLRKGNNHDTPTILVEYFTTEDKTFIFVISPQEFHIKTIELSSEKLASYIQNYWREVVNYPVFKGNEEAPTFILDMNISSHRTIHTGIIHVF